MEYVMVRAASIGNLGSKGMCILWSGVWVIRALPSEIQRIIAVYVIPPDHTFKDPTAALIGDCAVHWTPDAIIFATPDRIFLISSDDLQHVTQSVRRYWMRHRKLFYHICERCDPLSDLPCE